MPTAPSPRPDSTPPTARPSAIPTRRKNLNQTYQALLEWLKPAERSALLQEQKDWLARRRAQCETTENGHVFVDYVCMAAWTKIRLAILQGRFGGGKRVKSAALAAGILPD